MSWMRYMTLYSFRKLNPDWQMTLYLSEPNGINSKTWIDSPMQDFHNFTGRDFFHRIKDLDVSVEKWELTDFPDNVDPNKIGASHKSNFFKWWKLSRVSGFYCDLDVLFVKPIDELYEQCKQSDVVISHTNYFSIGLLGSSGQNRFFHDIYKHTFQSYNPKEYQSAGVMSLHSWCKQIAEDKEIPIYLCYSLIRRLYRPLRFFNMPMSWIYPWLWNQMDHVFRKSHKGVSAECVGIHWYAGAEVSQRYNNILDESNVAKYQNTFSHFARDILSK